uniref:Restriction endonuclease n=1 Tax=Candidatus Kentrum sp. TC TaxID=2126339 RepID=A0A450ZZX2_9GAMM|nr:MAG: Putative restriction endonuclease [Candidatus Kentron sp. TC]VFK59332.1 MAG: Putative restriction endonuclease [Candidatus Kentron sp. TC]
MTQEYRILSHEPLHAPSNGSFTADQIRDGDRYELSEGHRIYRAPAGERHAQHNATGASLLDSDPAVEWSGVDAGFSPNANTMRAPDVSVSPPPPGKRGWIPGAPLLAVEYADKGQNEADLRIKIKELLAAGTRFVWVVRLTGPQRVEVHAKGVRMRHYSASDSLEAPGILRNPVPVQALFDRRAAHRATLRNLLQREGYEDLDAVRWEGKTEGRIEGSLKARIEALFNILAARGLEPNAETRARIRDCHDPERLDGWLRKAAVANGSDEIF